MQGVFYKIHSTDCIIATDTRVADSQVYLISFINQQIVWAYFKILFLTFHGHIILRRLINCEREFVVSSNLWLVFSCFQFLYLIINLSFEYNKRIIFLRFFFSRPLFFFCGKFSKWIATSTQETNNTPCMRPHDEDEISLIGDWNCFDQNCASTNARYLYAKFHRTYLFCSSFFPRRFCKVQVP